MKMNLLQCSLLVLGLVAGSAMAQAPAPKGPTAQQCVQAYNQRHAQAMQQYQALSKAGRIDAAEAKQFSAMEASLRASQQAAAKGGLTLDECNKLHAQLNQQMATLQKMAASPAGKGAPAPGQPTVQQCMQAFNGRHAEMMKLHAAATKAGRLDAKEQQAFKAMETSLRQKHAAAAKSKGIDMAECQQLHTQLNQEIAALQKMAAAPGPVGKAPATGQPTVQQCMQAFGGRHAEMMKLHAAATKAGRLDAKEQQAFKAMEASLRQKHAAAAKSKGIDMAECQQLHTQLNQEIAALQKMAASPDGKAPGPVGKAPAPGQPTVQQCMQAFSQRHAQMMQQHAALTKAGRLDAQEQQAFKSMETSLRQRHAAAAKSGGIDLAECNQMHTQLNQEMAALQKMAASPARK